MSGTRHGATRTRNGPYPSGRSGCGCKRRDSRRVAGLVESELGSGWRLRPVGNLGPTMNSDALGRIKGYFPKVSLVNRLSRESMENNPIYVPSVPRLDQEDKREFLNITDRLNRFCGKFPIITAVVRRFVAGKSECCRNATVESREIATLGSSNLEMESLS